MSDLRRVQNAVASLLPEARAEIGDYLPPMQSSLAVACELYFVAFAMKNAHRPGAIRIADYYCQLSGLHSDQVYAFALERIRQRADEQAA